MINTIFYFPESLTFEEYRNLFDSEEISKNTIVFAKEQKSIYMGGNDYTEKPDAIITNSKDVLPFDSVVASELVGIFNATDQEPNEIIYSSFYKKFIAVISNGGTPPLVSYYYVWPGYEKYVDTANNNAPYSSKVYLCGGKIYVWNGTDLVAGGGGEQIQSDWNQTNPQSKDFIKNKPTIDEQPTEDSPNAVSSGGVYAEMAQDSQNFANMTKLGAPELDNGKTPNAYSIGDIFSQPIAYEKYTGFEYYVALVSGNEGELVNDQYKFYHTLSGADAVVVSLNLTGGMASSQINLNTQQKGVAQHNIGLEKAVANGVASLNQNSKIPTEQLQKASVEDIRALWGDNSHQASVDINDQSTDPINQEIAN